jgi:hypothetical protein
MLRRRRRRHTDMIGHCLLMGFSFYIQPEREMGGGGRQGREVEEGREREGDRETGFHSGGYQELSPLGYNGMWSTENQTALQRNMSPPSSGSKNKPNNKPS